MWIDGWDDPSNGSCVGCDWVQCPVVVHGGNQSMQFSYDNAFAGYSEGVVNTAMLTVARDWTIEGVGVLSLWFHGDPNNAPEPIYVKLANVNYPTAVVYHDNPDAVLINEWTEWEIDLQEFAAQGVNLTNVDSISIGFGDKNNTQPSGSGFVFFDDIRLYPR